MDNLRLYFVTYNVAAHHPEGDFKEMLGLTKDLKGIKNPDFYFIGLQEVKSQPHNYIVDTLFDDPWTTVFRKTLNPYGYIKIKTLRLLGIVLNVFCLKKHIIHVRDMKTTYTKTGLKGFWGNKGGVSFRLQIYGCSICIVNSHLTPHDNLLRERIDDYNSIIYGQKFDTGETTTILYHDYVFWIGDLNFRISEESNLDSIQIDRMVQNKDISKLFEFDQLINVMSSGEAFSELKEEKITFPPTYKFLFNSQEYDLKRRPSWTDRILYRVNENVYENITLDAISSFYKSVSSYCLSDHKPVVGEFNIKVFSNYSDRIVKFLPIDMWHVNELNIAVCEFSSDIKPMPWDWIGIFPENFTSLEDHIGYVYIINSNFDDEPPDQRSVKKPTNKIEIQFNQTFIRTPGRYQLIYFNQNSSSVLGWSGIFAGVCREYHGSSSSLTQLEW